MWRRAEGALMAWEHALERGLWGLCVLAVVAVWWPMCFASIEALRAAYEHRMYVPPPPPPRPWWMVW
jgi:hypothetical protein